MFAFTDVVRRNFVAVTCSLACIAYDDVTYYTTLLAIVQILGGKRFTKSRAGKTDADFKIYRPDDWTCERDFGISLQFCKLDKSIIVNERKRDVAKADDVCPRTVNSNIIDCMVEYNVENSK